MTTVASVNGSDGSKSVNRMHEAYLEIKRRILELDMPPGASFSEGELAAEMALSKTPVREALGRLRQEGLVLAVARSGYTVRSVTLKDARDLFHVRALLEGASAALAAERGIDVAELEELERLCRTSYDPDDRSSIVSFIDANTALHLTLARQSGNAVLASMLEQVLEQLQRMFHIGLANTARASEMIHEHQELLEAVRLRDPERAREIASSQASASERMVLEALLATEAIQSINLGGVHADRDGKA